MAKVKKRRCKICKKMFGLIHQTTTINPMVCSCKCAVIFYDKLPKPKGRAASREVAAMVGRRSMAEVKFDASFIEGKKVDAFYESDTFEYRVEETKKYTPDWLVVTPTTEFHIEFKGVLDMATRKKMKLVKQQHPELDIRIIFERAANKITKKSKTTYSMWADQHGFPWADNTLPKEWLK